MQIMVEVSDELAQRLSPVQGQLPQILELGLREWNTGVGSGFVGLADVLEFLASLPAPEESLAGFCDSTDERIGRVGRTIGKNP